MDYKNSVIYKILCKDKDITDCYVGSSCSPTSRKSAHKSSCNNENNKAYNIPVYRFIRDHGGWNNWEFVIIEKYPCNDKTELVIRERYWFEKLNTSLNGYYPQRKKKEYIEENKEKIAQMKKEYYEENKEKFLLQQKEYYEENKEKISQQHKEYREKNKEKILQRHKEYREENKDKFTEKVACELCGFIGVKHHLTRHKKSQKCQELSKLKLA